MGQSSLQKETSRQQKEQVVIRELEQQGDRTHEHDLHRANLVLVRGCYHCSRIGQRYSLTEQVYDRAPETTIKR